MRLLIVPSWYPTPAKPVNGIFIREQADALNAKHDVRVLYLDVLPRNTRTKPIHTVTRDRGYVEEIIEVGNLPFLWQFAYLLKMAQALRRLRRTFKPDVIHCHIAVPAAWGVVMLRWLAGAPTALTENSSEFSSWMKRRGLRWMARRAFAGADVVIAVSEGQKQRIAQTFNRKHNLVIVPNIVDTRKFTPTEMFNLEEGYRLLFVGLMDTTQKGVHILLDALANIVQGEKLNLPLHIDMVGDGSLRTGYEEQALRLGIEQHISFKGLQPHADVARMMSDYHALVLPSLHEALPLVIIEALASGRPVISTRCGGPEYMIDETNGRIVDPGQAIPLADAIVDVLTHLERYHPQQLAEAANTRYSYEAVTSSLEDIYDKLLTEEK